MELGWRNSKLDSLREQAAIDGINDRLSGDLSSSKEATVETFNGVLASLYTIKFEIDVTLAMSIEGDMDHVTIFLFTLSLDIILELLDPGVAFFPIEMVSIVN